MTGSSNGGTQDASSSLESKVKALELEKQVMEMAMVTLRSDFDEFRKQQAKEKQRLVEAKEGLAANLRELLLQKSKDMVRTSDSGTDASTCSGDEENTEEERDDLIALISFEKRKNLVQQTWKTVEGSLHVDSTKLFYKRLFEQHPSIESLFANVETEVQAAKLYQTLSFAVESLEDLDLLIPKLEELGARHATSFHIEREHYDAVGECLLWTLKTGLNQAWTDEVASAWTWVYGIISKTMADAGEKALERRRKSFVQKTRKDVESTSYEKASKPFGKREIEQKSSPVKSGEIGAKFTESEDRTKRGDLLEPESVGESEEVDLCRQPLLEKRKKLVRETWEVVQDSLSVEATKIFYRRLFEQYPSVVPLFSKGDIEVQASKLYLTLSLAVESLDDLDALVPKLEELGARHACSFKADRGHYDAVGECLLWTLKTGLSTLWTQDVADAWAWVYGLVSKTMADAGDKALTERRKSIVRKTWKDVEETLNVEATKLFYKHLFETHPTVIPLFGKGDIEVQAAKLYQTLCLAVDALDDMGSLIPTLEKLGARHALHFETERIHYDAVGESLLWTLETGLGANWTDNVCDAWTWVYGLISQTMADAGDKARLGIVPNSQLEQSAAASNIQSTVVLLEKALVDQRTVYEGKIKILEEEIKSLAEIKMDGILNTRDALSMTATGYLK